MIVNVYDGVYDSFEAAGAADEGFSGARWIAAQKKAVTAMLERSWADDYPQDPNIIALAASLVARSGAEPVRVLDIGGGLGATYLELLRNLKIPRQKLVYHIVENPQIVAEAAGINYASGTLGFSEQIPDKKFDLVYFGSSIHYFRDWKQVLKQVRAVAADYILFTRSPIVEVPSYVTLQTYYESRIPVHIINVEDMQAHMDALDYSLGFRSASVTKILGEFRTFPMAGIPERLRFKYVSDLMFYKK